MYTSTPAPTFTIPPVPTFNESHSIAIRIWHWTFFVVITFSLITVLFASTVFRTRNTVSLVQEQLQAKGATVTPVQAQAVAHEYNDQLWNLHRLAGYVLCGLLLSRLIIEVAQPREERLAARLRKAAGFKTTVPDALAKRKHYLRVKASYLVFYFLILLMALTGLVLAFEDVQLLKGIHIAAKKIHSLGQYFIYGFILVHLVGVIRADLSQHKGLVSGMIHGQKRP